MPILYEDVSLRKGKLADQTSIPVNPVTGAVPTSQIPLWAIGVAAAGAVAVVIGVALASRRG
jgi:hypothetical protein